VLVCMPTDKIDREILKAAGMCSYSSLIWMTIYIASILKLYSTALSIERASFQSY